MNNFETTQKKRIKASLYLDKLSNHPALGPEVYSGSGLPDCLWFSVQPCCKRGLCSSAKDGVTVYKGDEGWEKFEDKFIEEYKDYPDEEFQSIMVPYEEKFGEPWKFDHVEYWYEITFFIFEGNPYHKSQYFNYKKWQRYGGIEGGALTFEDMIIKATNESLKIFGNFNKWEDFRLPEEINNEKSNSMFNTSSENFLIENPEHISVNDGLTNLRWLKWFMETDWAKKNWNWELKKWKSFVKKIDRLEPEERKTLREKYK